MKKAAMILLLCLLFSFPTTALAAEINDSGPGDATITTTVPSEHKLTVVLDDEGHARVLYNGEEINDLTAPRLENLTVQVLADEGYEISKITLNGEDITSDLNPDGTLTLKGIHADSKLEVEAVEKKDDTSSDNTSDSTDDTSSNDGSPSEPPSKDDSLADFSNRETPESKTDDQNSKANEPATTSNTGDTSETPKTGSENGSAIAAAFALFTGAALTAVVLRRKNQEK